MPRVITLIDKRINTVRIDPPFDRLQVNYTLLDTNGIARETGDLILWVKLPDVPANPDGSNGEIPRTWYQLSPNAISWMHGSMGALIAVLDDLLETPSGEEIPTGLPSGVGNRTITLESHRTNSLLIDMQQQRVIISYTLFDGDGIDRENGELVLWKQLPTMPPDLDDTVPPMPPEWRQLSPEAVAWYDHAQSYVEGVLETLLKTPIADRMVALDRAAKLKLNTKKKETK